MNRFKQNILFKNYLITLNKNIIFYTENNILFFNSISNLRKYKVYNYFFIELNNNEVLFNTPIFFMNSDDVSNNKYLTFTKNKILYQIVKYFKECFYENKSKIKIIGRGWKIVKYNNQLLIKLGYSHMIFFNLQPIFKSKIKKKKKKYYIFVGNINNILNNTLNKIALMRIPDIYTKKGIFHHRPFF